MSLHRYPIEADVDRRGLRYTHPHQTIDDEPPFDLTGATDWERQEIRRYWHDAMRASHQMHAAAHTWCSRLADPDGRFRIDTIHGSGGHLPIDAGVRLSDALVRLTVAYDGYRHRLAMMRKES